MNVELVLDFLLMAASGVACFYCFMLSRRLKKLTSAEKGIGAGVAALSQSAEEVKSAVATAKAGADQAAARLEALLVRAEQKAAELGALYKEVEGAGEAIAVKTEGATRKYVDTLAPFLNEANDIADKLFAAIERAPRAVSAPTPAPLAAPVDEREPEYLEEVEQRPQRAGGVA
ncbi:MAG: hypothetical protein K2Q06_05860 [Parvularculaceae bacterium]|nr:hypothetical protein [Parvularculaceae bacterium]